MSPGSSVSTVVSSSTSAEAVDEIAGIAVLTQFAVHPGLETEVLRVLDLIR